MRKTILIVEDNPFIALDLQDIFEDAGFKVLGPVATVEAAMAYLRNAEIDVAMLDYNLGRETSLPLADALDDEDVPFAFLSGQIDKVIKQGLPKSRTIVPKPFDAQNLIGHVHRLLH